MANDFYTHGSYPSTNAHGDSLSMRTELDLISAGFDKLPNLAGNAGRLVKVNLSGTAMEGSNAEYIERDSATGAAFMPSGTTAQRPVSPATGYFRFNTDTGQKEIWTGTAWSVESGMLYGAKERHLATAGQTVFTVTGPTYFHANNTLEVYINGILQDPTDAYTTTAPTTVTFTEGLELDDEVVFTYNGAIGTVADSAYIDFIQAGTGAIPRNVQAKLRERVSGLDFYANGVSGAAVDPTGVVDSTLGIQAAMDAAYRVDLPAGTYKFSKLEFRHDNCVLVGEGQAATYLISTATSGSVLSNPDQATVTRKFCGVVGMQVNAASLAAGANKVIDWRSMQFGEIRNVWVYGSSAIGIAGVYLGTVTYGVTECTYNNLDNLYIGAVNYGVQFYDGANTNYLSNIRVQPKASGYGYHLAFGTGADRMGNNTFVSCHCEFPGVTVTGYALGTGAASTTIISPRLESLATGISVGATATKTTVVNPYYSSNTFNLSNSSQSLAIFGNNGLEAYMDQSNSIAQNYYNFTPAVYRYWHANGGYSTFVNDASATTSVGIYGSAYGGGTFFGVGASGSFSSHSGGIYGFGTSSAHAVYFGTNGTTRAKIQANGAVNFVGLASDPGGGAEGDFYYNATSKKLRFYNGTTWADV